MRRSTTCPAPLGSLLHTWDLVVGLHHLAGLVGNARRHCAGQSSSYCQVPADRTGRQMGFLDWYEYWLDLALGGS